MKRICFFLLAILSAEGLFGQIKKIDSLKHLLSKQMADTSRALMMIDVADYYISYSQDSSKKYLDQAKELSEELDFKFGIYRYYSRSAILSYTSADYTLALKHSQTALDLAKALGDSSLIMSTLGNMGIIYQFVGRFDKQLDYSLQALSLIERRKENLMLSSMYNNIALAYFNLSQYQKSLEYLNLSVKALNDFGGNRFPNRLFACFGDNYLHLYQTDSALHYYQMALDESVRLNDKYAEADIYTRIINVYENTGDFKSMVDLGQRSCSAAKEMQSRLILSKSLYNLAYAYYLNNEQALAKKHIHEALDIAREDTLIDEMKNIYRILSYIAAKDGDFQLSVKSKIKSDSIFESTINEEIISKTIFLQEEFETEKKNNQIRLQQLALKQKNILNYFFLGAFILLILLGVISYRNFLNRQRLQSQRIDKLEMEKQLTATEAVLKGEEQERTRLAKDLHDGLGGMLSGLKYSFTTMKKNLVMTPENQQAFERSIDMLDSSIKEMRRVAHNMMPESLLKFGLGAAFEDYCNDINESGALKINFVSIGLENVLLEQTTAITIYRIVQELINNILKHAAAKSAIVQVSNSGGHITVTVEDDGKGFDTAVLATSKGIGWTNIKNRVEFLKGTIDITSRSGSGSSIQIDFNI